VAIPYFLSMHYRGVLPPEWRFLPLFISLDIAHNVTTAFFLQTLKFHKFISATTFSFAFNTTAYIGSAMLLYYYLTQPVDPIAFFPAVAGCLMNLFFVYPKRGEPRLIQFIVALLALSPHTFRLAMDGDKFLPGVPGPSLAAGFVAVLAIVAWGLDPGLARRLTSWNTRFASSGSTLSHVLVLLGGGLFAFVLLNPLIKWQVGRLIGRENAHLDHLTAGRFSVLNDKIAKAKKSDEPVPSEDKASEVDAAPTTAAALAN